MVARSRVDFITWIRSKYMWKILNADMSYFHREKMGVLTDTLTLQAAHPGVCLVASVEIISSSALIIALLVAAFIVAPFLTLAVLGMLVIITLATQYHISKAKTMGTVGAVNENALQSDAVETLGGIHLIKSFLLEPTRWLGFHNKADDVANISYSLLKNRGQMAVLQELALFGLIGAVVFLGVSILDLGIAVVVALLFILYRMTPKVTGLNQQRQGLSISLGALVRVKTIIDEASDTKIINGKIPFTGLQSGIHLKNVSFSYDGAGQVLQDTSFTLEKGKITAISGTSGAGKTTLVDLILRHYDPTEGSILVDGVDLKEIDSASWRSMIGVVSQDTFLFNDTIANNIALDRAEVTKEDIIRAAKQAFAHEFIEELPDGYETSIGDRGWNLSGGQRQRIALAPRNSETSRNPNPGRGDELPGLSVRTPDPGVH